MRSTLVRSGLALCLALAFGGVANGAIITLGLNPSLTSVSPDQTFTVDVTAQAASPMATVFCNLTFDATRLQVTGTTVDPALNFFPSTGTVGSGLITLIGGGNVSGFGGGAPVKVATITFKALNIHGQASVATAFTAGDESALVGAGALAQSDMGFGSTQITITPEPASLALLLTGAGMLFRRGLRRRSA